MVVARPPSALLRAAADNLLIACCARPGPGTPSLTVPERLAYPLAAVLPSKPTLTPTAGSDINFCLA